MKKWVLLLLLLVSCVSQPYAKPGQTAEEKVVEKVLVQCWDNSTADSVDKCPPKAEAKAEVKTSTPVTKVIVEEPPQKIPIAKKLLADARSKFKTYAYLLADRVVVVDGSKVRHLFLRLHDLDSRTSITDVYVDTDKKEAMAYCNIEREGRDMAVDGLDWERAKCKNYVDKPIPVPYEKWVTKGPIEYLEDFSNLEPILVEDNVQTLSIGGNQKTIQPSLHYVVDGKRVVLRIDKRYQVPIKIEYEGQQSVDFRDTFFDVMVLYGSQEKIGPEWVEYQPVSEYWKAAASK
jgi:hypothetical protein